MRFEHYFCINFYLASKSRNNHCLCMLLFCLHESNKSSYQNSALIFNIFFIYATPVSYFEQNNIFDNIKWMCISPLFRPHLLLTQFIATKLSPALFHTLQKRRFKSSSICYSKKLKVHLHMYFGKKSSVFCFIHKHSSSL